tara:strand:- start:3639 stop:4379 length:741 start_codon:yes stop_codon:yes gene_type:complete
MNNMRFVEISKIKLKNPIFICGLPDSGFVGKICSYHFIKGVKAIKFAELYSAFLPAQVIVNENGIIEPLKFEFYYKKGKQDLIIFTGDVQAETAEGQYNVSNAVLQFIKNYNCIKVYTFGAFVTPNPSNPPKVYGTANSNKSLKQLSKYGIENMKKGNIIGMNGLLFSLADKFGLEGFGIYSETRGDYPDPKAAKQLIKVISKITGLKPNLRELIREEKRLKKFQNKNNNIESETEIQNKTSRYIT